MVDGPNAVGTEAFDLLLTGGTVVTVDASRGVIPDGAVAVRGDRIVAVGSASHFVGSTAGRRVDCRGKVVIPGMVDLHDHLFQHLLRGLGDDIPDLYGWLSRFMLPTAFALTPEIVRAGGLLGSMLALRSGITSVVDHHYGNTELEAIAALGSAMKEVGVRGVIARTIFGPTTVIAEEAGVGPFFGSSIEEEIESTSAAIDLFVGDPRVVVWPAPDHIPYNDVEMVSASVDLARRRDVGWYAHCSEVELDVSGYVTHYGARPIDLLYEEGLLSPSAVLAHCNWLSDREMERLAETGTSVAHNPSSNSLGMTGICHVRELLDAGVRMGIGVDGIGSMGFDMFEEMMLAVQIQRMTRVTIRGLEGALRHEEAIEMATLQGAASIGLEAGSIEVGKLADLAVVDFEEPWLSPGYATVALLVRVARAHDVSMTIVGGEVVYEDGRFPLLGDQESTVAEVRARSGELLERAGIEPEPTRWHFSDLTD